MWTRVVVDGCVLYPVLLFRFSIYVEHLKIHGTFDAHTDQIGRLRTSEVCNRGSLRFVLLLVICRFLSPLWSVGNRRK